ncbi:hypothetical protein MPF19_13490 [Polaribacter sp. Z014]|uniref:hypothetical protein n=1 Tax=unclassified Polaribacter TaxID=196858 RepID=UPI00193C10DA|nr:MULTISPECIES: hypothetical protein [unclassified Polaribacter]MCL7764434.1 hypothetical protein [Polaribacter sp. Z014]QVY66913.1 hypothetical protein JOP69_06415 [Polaribacter sp. Q13]
MRRTLTFIAIFSFLLSSAQYKKGIIFLTDSTEIKGLIKVRTLDGIKYKENDSSSVKKLNDRQLIGYNITEDGIETKYRFKKIESKFKNKQRFGPGRKIKTDQKIRMKIVRSGKINLYSVFVSNAGSAMGMGLPVSSGNLYYIEKDNKTIKLGTKIKSKYYYLFEDCPELIKKIKTKELKHTNLIEIIEYYNKNCDIEN